MLLLLLFVSFNSSFSVSVWFLESSLAITLEIFSEVGITFFFPSDPRICSLHELTVFSDSFFSASGFIAQCLISIVSIEYLQELDWELNFSCVPVELS